MTHQLFEERDHAALYQKYRYSPPGEVKDIIIQYLDKKKERPHVLAVDLGCGTGQITRQLAPHFQEVVGFDISEAQLEEARAVAGYPNLTYRVGKAEDLPLPDGSVDLLTVATAVHWFDQPKFLAEASRVLKPGGCMALVDFKLSTMKLHYHNCGDKLRNIFEEAIEQLKPHMNSRVIQSEGDMEDIYTLIPFPDKERIQEIKATSSIPVSSLMGFMESWSMFQTYKKTDAQSAEKLLCNTQKRILEEMGATAPETQIQETREYHGVLAAKPQ